MIKDMFENVISYESDNSGRVYLIHLGIKEFSKRFNVAIKYLEPNPHTTPFEPMDLGIYVNVIGNVIFENSILSIDGEALIFDGKVKLERLIHPETDIIVRLFDNLTNDQIIRLLNAK
jgi:hypothetical protein